MITNLIPLQGKAMILDHFFLYFIFFVHLCMSDIPWLSVTALLSLLGQHRNYEWCLIQCACNNNLYRKCYICTLLCIIGKSKVCTLATIHYLGFPCHSITLLQFNFLDNFPPPNNIIINFGSVRPEIVLMIFWNFSLLLKQ